MTSDSPPSTTSRSWRPSRRSFAGPAALQNSLLSSTASSSSAVSPRQQQQQQPPGQRSWESFLEELEHIRLGPLHELESRLTEAKAFHAHTLRSTNARAEREAIARVESCAQSTRAAALEARRRLEALKGEVSNLPASVGATEANVRHQSFAGVSERLKTLLYSHYEAQQKFKTEMEAKLRRQFRASNPEADDAALAAMVEGHRSPQSSVQADGRPGSSTSAVALEAMENNTEELENLARAAQDLRQAFIDVESLVIAQGEVMTDIEEHLGRTQDRTKEAEEQLVRAHVSNRRCQYRWCVLLVLLAVIAVILIVLLCEHGHS